MTDSIAILPPGWRAMHPTTGDYLPDGILKFYDADTSNPLVVYSDDELATSLGIEVNCNTAGYPVTSGNAKTLIYTGVDAYRIVLSSESFGGDVFDHPRVRGALDTSSFLTSAAVADETVVNISTNRTITSADKGKLINVNCTASAFQITFNAASVLSSGFFVGIRHAGTANQVKIIGNGTDVFDLPGVSTTAFALTGLGQSTWIACDGTGFKASYGLPPLIDATTGIIAIADRLSTPPGSPAPGARYLLTAGPSGAWSTFAEHDIAEANGQGGWFKYRPVNDCGWLAYVADEDLVYLFSGSNWVGTTIHINSLSEDTTPDFSSDFFGAFDVGTGQPKKVKIRPNRVYAEYLANTNLSTVIPADDTIPQITEGTEILSAVITPTSATNRIRVHFQGPAARDGTGTACSAALFNGAANAVAATVHRHGADESGILEIMHEEVSGGTSAITYSIRVGPTAGNMRMNGTSAARFFGGVSKATLIVEEIPV